MINIVYHDLPIGVQGLCREDECGNHTIVLNSRYNDEANRHTYLHEMTHIASGHFSEAAVDYIETR